MITESALPAWRWQFLQWQVTQSSGSLSQL
jgi:hypothetical protein